MTSEADKEKAILEEQNRKRTETFELEGLRIASAEAGLGTSVTFGKGAAVPNNDWTVRDLHEHLQRQSGYREPASDEAKVRLRQHLNKKLWELDGKSPLIMGTLMLGNAALITAYARPDGCVFNTKATDEMSIRKLVDAIVAEQKAQGVPEGEIQINIYHSTNATAGIIEAYCKELKERGVVNTLNFEAEPLEDDKPEEESKSAEIKLPPKSSPSPVSPPPRSRP